MGNIFEYLKENRTLQGFQPKPAAAATTAAAGTLNKLRIFQARIAAGEELFHPDDPWLEDWEQADSKSIRYRRSICHAAAVDYISRDDYRHLAHGKKTPFHPARPPQRDSKGRSPSMTPKSSQALRTQQAKN